MLTSLPGSLPRGKERLILDKSPLSSGSDIAEFGVDADNIVISLFASSVSGDLTVTVETVTDDGQALTVATFPVISAPTTNLLLKKTAAIMDRIRITATYTDSCQYQVRVRGIGTGESSVKILGADEASASQTDISTADVIVASSLTDRSGLVVKNNNSSGTLFIGFTLAETTAANGYPIGPGESLGIDVAAGQEVYGVASAGTIDVRIMQAGG